MDFKNGFSEWISKMDFQKWIFKNGFSKMDFQKWIFRMDFLICEEPNEPRDFTVIPKDKETNYLLSKLY